MDGIIPKGGILKHDVETIRMSTGTLDSLCARLHKDNHRCLTARSPMVNLLTVEPQYASQQPSQRRTTAKHMNACRINIILLLADRSMDKYIRRELRG